MKRKVKRMLAMFLTFIMVFSMATVYVSAAEEGTGKSTEAAGKPELSKKTADSVTLKTKEGYVYGIQENGSTWKWAEDKQYDKTAKTVSFTGLKAETEYVFAQKTKDAETVQDADQLKVKTEAAAIQAETPKQEEVKNETPKVEETPKTDDTDKNAETNKPQDDSLNTEVQKPEGTDQTNTGVEGNKVNVPDGTEKPDETQKPDDTNKPDGSGDVNPPTDMGNTLDETPAIDNNTAVNPPSDSLDPPKTDGDKKEEPKGDTSKSHQQQNNALVNKDNEIHNSTNTNTDKNTPQKADTPEKPLVEKVTDTSVVLKPGSDADKYTYSYKLALKDSKAKAVELTNDTGEFKDLKPDTDYLAYVMIKGNDKADKPYSDSDWSVAAEVHTLKAAADKPKAAPKLAEKTDTTIKLDTSTADLEYGVYLDSGDISWNSTGEFKGLTAGKEYKFVTRVKFDKDKQMESPVSDVLKVTTKKAAAAAPEAPVCIGRTENSITLRAVNGQEYAVLENGNPVKWQDSEVFSGLKPNTRYSFVTRVKYNPDEAMESKVSSSSSAKTIITFEGSSVTGIEVNGVYDKNAVVNKAGKMELQVVFQLEEYTEKGWTDMTVEKKTITVPFSVKEQYTITASAGSNGKISPSGSVKVMEGNDATFTITPNKGYQISQVTVDGKAVTVKNSKYTFEDVSANHKISVTFKKLTKTVPKTGDTMNMAGYLMLAVLSAGAVFAVVVSAKRKKMNRR